MKAKIYVGVTRSGKTRVANMISEHVGKEKTFWVDAKKMKRDISNLPSLLAGIPDTIELIVFDDCLPNLEYSFFFPVEDNRFYGGDLKFKLIVAEKGKKTREILIAQIIFTTEKLNSKWFEFGYSFTERFDIVELPLNCIV